MVPYANVWSGASTSRRYCTWDADVTIPCRIAASLCSQAVPGRMPQ